MMTESDRAVLAALLVPGRDRVEVPAAALTRLLDVERRLRSEVAGLQVDNERLRDAFAGAVGYEWDES